MWTHDFQNSLIVGEPGRALVFEVFEQTFVGLPTDVRNNHSVCGRPFGHYGHVFTLTPSLEAGKMRGGFALLRPSPYPLPEGEGGIVAEFKNHL
jgi:hypothetical protein